MRYPNRYRVITFCYDCGTDEKMDYPTIKAARAAIRTRYKGYDGYAIYDHLHDAYAVTMGEYPNWNR